MQNFLSATKRMMRPVYLLGMVALLGIPRVVEAGLLEKFQADYPAAAAKLETAYGQMRVSGTCTNYDSSFPVQLVAQDHFDMLASHGQTRAVFTTLSSELKRWPAGSIIIKGGDGALTYRCFKKVDDKDFTFNWFGSLPNYQSWKCTHFVPLVAPYSVLDARVVDFFAHGTLIGAEESTFGGQAALKVSFKLSDGLSNTDSFYFEPSTLALLGFSLPRGGGFMKGVVTYGDAVDGIPVLKSCEFYTEITSPASIHKAWRIEVEHLDFAETSIEEFRPTALAQFGVKELPGVDSFSDDGSGGAVAATFSQPRSYASWGYMSVAIGLTSFGVYFYRKSHRKDVA